MKRGNKFMKIIKVKDCFDCPYMGSIIEKIPILNGLPYRREIPICLMKIDEKETELGVDLSYPMKLDLESDGKIPDWCPLEDIK
jgi:hypothetical protein